MAARMRLKKVERGGKNLEAHTLGFFPLEPIEIPQNRQRNLWNSLDKNILDLEKLAERLGGRLYSACPLPSPLRQRIDDRARARSRHQRLHIAAEPAPPVRSLAIGARQVGRDRIAREVFELHAGEDRA